MRRKIERSLLELLSQRMARQANAVELMPKYCLQKSAGLEAHEKREIDRIWSPLTSKINYRYWEVYKGLFGFNPLLVPDDIYVKLILRVLNPMRLCYALQNKNMYPTLYSNLRMPRTLAKCIDGQTFDHENNLVDLASLPQLLSRLSQVEKLIIKPSADSCGGNGISIVSVEDKVEILKRIEVAGKNFVIQEVLSQSDATKRFNAGSLNTFRVNTLFLNGRVSVENIMFRHGRGDSVVDNAGSGGVCVGFDPDGKAVGKAIDASLRVYEHTPFGEPYSSLCMPQLNAVSKTATEAHRRYLPMMGHAAWDFALDERDNPVFIEVNLGWPGIMTEQLSSCRPVFGKRTEEVIAFAKENYSKMSFTDFIGHWT